MAIRYLSGINVDSNTLFVDDANNRVGIGTASPAYKLEVNGSFGTVTSGIYLEYNSGILYHSGGSGNYYQYISGANYVLINRTATGALVFGTVDTERMRITSAGNLYVGATGDARGGSTTRALIKLGSGQYYTELQAYNTSSSVGLLFSDGAGGNYGLIDYTPTDDMLFYTASAERMRITSAGNVGIGTTSPVEKLDVRGGAYINGGTNDNAYDATLYVTANSSNDWGIFVSKPSHDYGIISQVANGSDFGFSVYDGTTHNFRVKGNGTTLIQGNVGIGTTSPATKLHIFGSGDQSITIQSSTTASSTSSFVKYIRATTGSARTWWTGVGIQGGTDSSFSFYDETAGSERMRIASSGYVGIGIQNPSYLLDVNGSINARSNSQVSGNAQVFTIDGTNHAYYAWNVAGSRKAYAGFGSSGSTTFELINENTGSFIIGTNGSQQLIITSAGNVGIGTTSPSYKASVVAANGNYWNGTAFTGTTLAISIENSQPGGYDPVLIYNQADSGGTLKNSGAIGMVGTGPWTAGNNASQVSDMYFLVRNSSGSISERLRIKSTGAAQLNAYGSGSFTGTVAYNLAVDSSGNIIETAGGVVDGSGTANYVSKWSDANTLTDSIIYDNGTNVGIGTSAPSGARTVIKTPGVNDANEIALQLNHGDGGLIANQEVQLGFGQGDGTTSLAQIGAAYEGSSFNGSLIFRTNGASLAERMRITSAGNVGIGTTGPTSLLHISGIPQATSGSMITIRDNDANGSNTSFSGVFFSSSPGTDYSIGKLSSGSDGLFQIRNGNNGTGYLTINNSGNVGIGMTSPNSKLVIARDVTDNDLSQFGYVQLKLIGATANAKQLLLGFETENNYGFIQTLQDGASWSTYNLALQWKGGNVGVGNNAPSQKLHVSGNIRVTGAYYDSNNSAGSSGQVLSSTGSGTDWVSLSEITGVDGTGTANYIAKWSDTDTITNSQVFDNGTNVGINNASPKTKLDVNGAIGFGSKSMSMTDTFADALTINMFDHHGCYVKLTAFGDWVNHSTIAYLGEFFIQASAGAYNEPGIIIRQVDNTGGGDDIQAQIVDPAGTGTRDFVIQLKATSASYTPFTAHLQYEVRGLYNSVS